MAEYSECLENGQVIAPKAGTVSLWLPRDDQRSVEASFAELDRLLETAGQSRPSV